MQLHHSDEALFTMHMANKRVLTSTKSEEIHHNFVPYAEPPEKPMPNMAGLISLPTRYYLHPVKDESAFQADKFGRVDSEVELAVSRHEEITEPALDLGTASLQRIVSQMKGLKFEVQEKKFNKDAAKLSGLKSYSQYITEYDTIAVSAKPFRGTHSLYKKKPAGYKHDFVPGGYGLRGKSDIGDDYPLTSGEKITVAQAAVQ